MTLTAERGHILSSSSTEVEYPLNLRAGLAETHKFEINGPAWRVQRANPPLGPAFTGIADIGVNTENRDFAQALGDHEELVRSIYVMPPDSPRTYLYRTGLLYNGLSISEPRDIRCFIYVVEPSSNTILVDFPGPESPTEPENPHYMEYRKIVERLQSGGRELVAEELVELLRDIQEEGEEVNIYSLRAMAQFLVKNKEFADPIFGPDPADGIIQAEWRIFGDGLLVLAFIECDRLLCVARAEPPDREAIRISVEQTVDRILEDYGYLVPKRF